VARVVALLLAALLPGLPLANAAAIAAEGPCAMHRTAVKRLPCHEMQAPRAPATRDCCDRETRFALDACTCGHGEEAMGVSREPSLAPKRARVALVLPELRLVEHTTAPSVRPAERPDPRPPSLRS
jgi:hypothetical protein